MLVLSIHVSNFVVAGMYLEVVPSYYILAKHYTCFKEYCNSPNLFWLLDNHIFLACYLLPPSCWVDGNLHNHLIISFIMLSSTASGQPTLFIIHGNEFLFGIHRQAFLLSFVRLVNVNKTFHPFNSPSVKYIHTSCLALLFIDDHWFKTRHFKPSCCIQPMRQMMSVVGSFGRRPRKQHI